jgi:hypothetical protein
MLEALESFLSWNMYSREELLTLNMIKMKLNEE